MTSHDTILGTHRARYGPTRSLNATVPLDASDPDAISWHVDVVVDLGSSFGTADSASTIIATRVE